MSVTAKSKDEADKLLRKLVGVQRGKFCPQIGSTCVRNCACFYMGSVKEIEHTDTWMVYEPSCTHALIGGVVYVEIT